MFHRDAQTLVIIILRGTCIHGNIVIHISSVHAQGKFQRGFQNVIMIVHVFFVFVDHAVYNMLDKIVIFSKQNT